MLTGSIYGWENGGDDIFDPQSSRNRDDCLEPMRVLNYLAEKNGILLHTADVNDLSGAKPSFSLYVESIDFVPGKTQKNYLILYETSLTVPRNADFDYLKQFDAIFTWDTSFLAKGFGRGTNFIPQNRFIQIQYPNPIPVECESNFNSPSFEQRKEFACLIGSNRHANCVDPRELYSERVKAIRWFEKHAKGKLKLYGNGWNVPPKKFGRIGKFRYRLEKIIPWLLGKSVFPSYQGPAKIKFEVLSRTKFCICFENARDIPGYITEKIFDCFFAGCVPVYWGDPDVENHIPSDCFINFREFLSYEDLYKFLDAIEPEQYLAYQIAIKKFLLSPNFIPFGSKRFAETIIQKIMQDFETPTN